MSFDHWKQTDPDPGRESVDIKATEPDLCRDCGVTCWEGAHGTPHGTSCDHCWRLRAMHGVEFDPRTLSVILLARRGAA